MTVATVWWPQRSPRSPSSRSRRRSSPCSPDPAVIADGSLYCDDRVRADRQTFEIILEGALAGAGTRCGPSRQHHAHASSGCRSPVWSSAIGSSDLAGALRHRCRAPGSSWPCSGSAAPAARHGLTNGGDSHHSATDFAAPTATWRGEGRAVVPGALAPHSSHHAPGAARAIARAQYILSRVWHRFPQGACTWRSWTPASAPTPRAGGVDAGHFFVAPDNGLLSFCRRTRTSWGCRSGRRRAYLPSARRVRAGGGPARPGRAPVTLVVRHRGVPLPLPAPTRRHGAHRGSHLRRSIRYVDLEYPGDQVEPGVRHQVAGRRSGRWPARSGMWDGARWSPSSGSGGTVEIAVRDGSAARLLGVGVGAEVRA